MGKWALLHDRRFVEVFDSFQDAAEAAVERFGRGPYLIRQIGSPPITLPASVMYNPVNARGPMWFHSQEGVSGSNLLALFGPTLLVDIGFDPGYRVQVPVMIPVPSVRGIEALVDTGAAESCIDSFLSSQLNLPVIDRRPIYGVGGQQETDIYLAQIHVRSLGFTIYGAFAAVDLAVGGQRHQALIGRTFLRNCTMIYEGRTGSVTISI